MALQGAIDDTRRADRAGSLLVLVGVVNLPIIYYSVKWWNTLHQGQTFSMEQGSKMDPMMGWTLLIMVLAFWAYTIVMAMKRVRCIILEREPDSKWVRELEEVRT